MDVRVSTSEKIRQIVHDIDLLGIASLTRLTVLKKVFGSTESPACSRPVDYEPGGV
jgi:hypothetical protein